MRRAQSVRHYARPSLALMSDDLGMLREGDESNEDILRRQLLDKDRECDKLQNHIQQLQDQLSQRPPLEAIQELEKEYKNLELLLQGTQRENERCMGELERAKTREKMLERELARLAGDNWQSSLDIPPSSAIGIGTRSGMIHHQRANTISSSPLAISSPISLTIQQHQRPSSSSSSPSASPNPEAHMYSNLNPRQQQDRIDAALKAEQQIALRAHIEQVRMLVLGMEQRLQIREEKLVKKVEKAESEGRRFEQLRKVAAIDT